MMHLGNSAAHVAAVSACSAAAGYTTVRLGPMSLVPAALAIAAWAAFVYPTAVVVAILAATGIFNGIYFTLRADLLGVPVSVLDFFPALLLAAAVVIRTRSGDRAWGGDFPPIVTWLLVLFVAGLSLGVAVGIAAGAERYELLRVLRLETGLLLVFAAACLAASSMRWQRAVFRGAIACGVLVAVQLILGFAWARITGSSLWAMLPFGAPVDDLGTQVAAGNLNVLRTNAVSPYLMLPALAVGVAGRVRRSAFLVTLVVCAEIISLSRGAWIATALTVALGLALRNQGRARLKAAVVYGSAIAVGAVASFAVWPTIVEARVDQLVALRTESERTASVDPSAHFRQSETRAAWAALTESPTVFLAGTGAGVIISHSALGGRPTASALLENNVLSRWANLSVLSVVAAAILLVGAFLRGRNAADARGIGHLTVSLPPILIAGAFGGTLMSPQSSILPWVIAGTVLALPLSRNSVGNSRA